MADKTLNTVRVLGPTASGVLVINEDEYDPSIHELAPDPEPPSDTPTVVEDPEPPEPEEDHGDGEDGEQHYVARGGGWYVHVDTGTKVHKKNLPVGAIIDEAPEE